MTQPNKKLVESEWKEFEKTVMPAGASDLQRLEMRRSFYAGVWATLQTINKLVDESLSDDMAAEAFKDMHNECIEFMNRIGVDR